MELAAKYGFTDDGQSIADEEEDKGLQGEPSHDTGRTAVAHGKSKQNPVSEIRGRKSAVQKIRKVAPKNQLSSIEVRLQQTCHVVACNLIDDTPFLKKKIHIAA